MWVFRVLRLPCLSVGVNVPDHRKLFLEFQGQLHKKVTRHVVLLSSKDCVGGKLSPPVIDVGHHCDKMAGSLLLFLSLCLLRDENYHEGDSATVDVSEPAD